MPTRPSKPQTTTRKPAAKPKRRASSRKPAAAAGRPSKLDDATTDKIVAILRLGGYVETAAIAAGISKQTFYNWFNRGDPDGTKRIDAPYRRFRERIEQATAEGEANNVAIVQAAAASDWRAAAWLLERRHPDKFAGPRGRRLDASVHPADFAAGEPSSDQQVMDDQVGPDGRPL